MSVSGALLKTVTGAGAGTASWLNGARLSILIFHRVTEQVDPLFPQEMHASRFDALLGQLKRCWRFVPLEGALAQLDAGTLRPGSLAVTFDDGYADNATVARPILKKHGVPATVFVASGFLGGGRMWNDTIIEAVRRSPRDALDLSWLDEGAVGIAGMGEKILAIQRVIRRIKHLPQDDRAAACERFAAVARANLPCNLMMTPEQVRELHRSGIGIGAHTVTHPILATLADTHAEHEIRQGKSDLESLLDASVNLFAYPNGRPTLDYLPIHADMVRRAGYTAAVSTAWGAVSTRSDRFQLPRFTPWDQGNTAFHYRLLANFFRGSGQAGYTSAAG